MTSSTVKCASCNVVIDEMLAFIANKIDVMDQDSLMRICVSSFDVAEVEKSKNLLFDAITTDIRKIKRRNKSEGKIQRDLEDIITVLKSLDPDLIPVFVAKELHKLPPLTFDHCDVSALLKDIVLLKSQIVDIKNTYVTTDQLHDLEIKIHSYKYDSLINDTPIQNHLQRFNFVNTRTRGANLLNSGPMAIGSMYDSTTNESAQLTSVNKSPDSRGAFTQPQPQLTLENKLDPADGAPELRLRPVCIEEAPASDYSARAVSVDGTDAITYSAIPAGGAMEHKIIASPVASLRSSLVNEIVRDECEAVRSEMTHNSDNGRGQYKNSVNETEHNVQAKQTATKPTFADIGNSKGKWSVPEKDEEWKIVQRRRFSNKLMTNKGKASLDQNSKFKAAEIKVPLFITNVHKDVTERDIAEYVRTRTQEKVLPIKIKMKHQRSYNAFKIFVSKSELPTFLDNSFWPNGISFRRFVNYVNKNRNAVNMQDDERQPTKS